MFLTDGVDLKSLKGKKVVITGGCGFIGHNLALELSGLGATVDVIDGLTVNNLGFYNSQYRENPNTALYLSFIDERLALLKDANVGIHVSDLRDYSGTSALLSRLEPDVVVHLAAVAHANRSNKDPFSTFDHSFRTLENVLDWCKTRGDRCHLIFFSSSMVYGDFDGDAVSEDRVCSPKGIYGALKYGAEKLVIAYHQVFGIKYTIVRPSALYGERCVSRRVGQAFIENAIRGQDLSINGDGEEGLDFTYVKDLVQGVIRIILTPDSYSEVFNLTFGSERSLNDLAAIVQSRFPGVKVVHKKRDALMPERGTLDISKARELLGYCPDFSVEVGFAAYIDWYQSFYEQHQAQFAS